MSMKSIMGCLAAFTLVSCSDNRPNVILETELGAIEIEVYSDKAPLSSADFLYYVDEGLYDDQGFYRVVRADNDPLSMGMSLIQGGRLDLAPLTQGIDHERTTETGLSNVESVISLARNEPGSGSAAFFFINLGDNSFLDYAGVRNPDGEGYATFGKVVKGLDVARQIQVGEVSADSDDAITEGQFLKQPVKIKRVYRK